MKTRGADLAGSWYPGGESDCRRAIERFLDPDFFVRIPGEILWEELFLMRDGFFPEKLRVR